ncbi:hypothetical protein C8J56DRAFT_1048592 [Mycena floridula]|nr:hypothetical protein C8J56DRAFT_1048592 [Mycena floridula]
MQPIPLDVVRCILEEVRRSSPQDLPRAALASKDFATISQFYIFHTICIRTGSHIRQISQLLVDKPALRPWVKEIHVELYASGRQEQKKIPALLELWKTTFSLLQQITDPPLKPKKFRWKSSGFDLDPEDLTEISEAYPECSIFLDQYHGGPIPFLSNLVSVTIPPIYIYQDPFQQFYPVLKNAPRLRSISITAYRPSGCAMGLPRNNKPFLSYRESFPKLSSPALRTVDLHHLYFSAEVSRETWVNMDWSRLHTLNLNHCGLDELLPTLYPTAVHLPVLKSLKIRTWKEIEDDHLENMKRVIESASPLEELVLEGPYTSLASTVAKHHGETLLKLTMHDPERPALPQRIPIAREMLIQLGKSCSKLERLEIDLEGTLEESKTLIMDLKDILSEDLFPSLKALSFWSLLGIIEYRTVSQDARFFERPYPDHSDDEIHDLLSDVMSSCERLTSIVVNIGETKRPAGRGWPGPHWRSWEGSNSQLYKMTRAQHDLELYHRESAESRWSRRRDAESNEEEDYEEEDDADDDDDGLAQS